MSGDAADDEPTPRPRFGEYATPEEQAARIRQPDVTDLIDSGQAPRAGSDAAAAAASPARTADRVATWALLGYGLFTVVSAIPAVADYGAFAETVLSSVGVESPPDAIDAGRWWGLAAAIVLGVGWLVSAVLSLRRLRSGRVAFWIPLVAGLVCNVLASILLMVPLVTDRGLLDLVQETTLAPPS